MENQNDIKEKIEILINHIEKLNIDKKNIDCMFTSYKYKAALDELILDSLARYLCFCTKDKPNKRKCYSFIMVCENNDKKKINKIFASSNNDSNELEDMIKDIFKIISKQNEELEQELFSKLLVQSSSKIEAKINNVVSNLNCKKEELENLKYEHSNIFTPKKGKEGKKYILNDLLNALISAFDLCDKAKEPKNLFSDILWLLNLKMDIYFISLFKDIYEIDFENIYCHIAKGFNEIRNNKFIHTESKLAMFYLTKIENIGNPYIGISKLCCPFCARFLRDLKFRFRGNHCCFENSRYNWTIAMPLQSEPEFIDNIRNIRMLYGLNNCDKFITKLNQIQTDSNGEINKISSKKQISNLLKFDEFILENELFNHGLKTGNVSYDFKLLKDLENENEDIKDILSPCFKDIFKFYSNLRNKMNKLFLDECKVSNFILAFFVEISKFYYYLYCIYLFIYLIKIERQCLYKK